MAKCNQRRKVGMVIVIAIEFAAGENPRTEVKALLLLAVKVIETVFHPLSYFLSILYTYNSTELPQNCLESEAARSVVTFNIKFSFGLDVPL